MAVEQRKDLNALHLELLEHVHWLHPDLKELVVDLPRAAKAQRDAHSVEVDGLKGQIARLKEDGDVALEAELAMLRAEIKRLKQVPAISVAKEQEGGKIKKEVLNSESPVPPRSPRPQAMKRTTEHPAPLDQFSSVESSIKRRKIDAVRRMNPSCGFCYARKLDCDGKARCKWCQKFCPYTVCRYGIDCEAEKCTRLHPGQEKDADGVLRSIKVGHKMGHHG